MKKALALLIVLLSATAPAAADSLATKNTALAAASGTTVVLAHPGVLYGLVVTVAGTASVTCYDNASAASGTVVLVTPATTTVGASYSGAGGPNGTSLVNGLTCSAPTSSAGVTVGSSS